MVRLDVVAVGIFAVLCHHIQYRSSAGGFYCSGVRAMQESWLGMAEPVGS
jgi:hypothetical protein